MYLIEYEAMKFDLSIVCASFTKGSRETRVIREGFCSALIKLNFRSLIRAGCLVLFLRLPFFFSSIGYSRRSLFQGWDLESLKFRKFRVKEF